jgi:type I restriction enzyme S subunit
MSDQIGEQDDLPSSWLHTQLGRVVNYGRTTKVEPSDIPSDAWVLELEDIEKDTSRILQRMTFSQRQSKSTKNKFLAGDVLYGKLRPYLNKVVIADQPGYCTTEIVPINAGLLDNRFLFYWLKHPTFLKYVEAESHGLNMPRLGTDTGMAAPFVLAPREEQTRIADQLDTLFARINACHHRLDAVPALLKRFRQAVLDAATLGELTEDWREANGLNTGWSKVTLEDIADVQGGVTKDTKKQTALDEEVPYLRVANVQRGYIDLREVKTIRVPAEKLEKLLLESGDILFNEGGDLDKLGRGWVWEGQIPRCTFQNHVFRARLKDPNNQPKFVSWWGNSRGLEYFIRSGKQTTNLASINKTMLAALPITLPPPNEQAEIVRRVEALFNLADRIEARYAAVCNQARRLTPLTLAKAFRGELVPQDPNDEPASALLARIAAQRDGVTKAPKIRKPRTSSAARAPKESATMTKSQQDDDVKGKPYLAGHLHRLGGPVEAQALFKVSELPVADFYKQLAWEVAQGLVKDNTTTLESGHAAG